MHFLFIGKKSPEGRALVLALRDHPREIGETRISRGRLKRENDPIISRLIDQLILNKHAMDPSSESDFSGTYRR